MEEKHRVAFKKFEIRGVMSSHDELKRVVILGASQAGERLAKKLARRSDIEVTVIDMVDER